LGDFFFEKFQFGYGAGGVGGVKLNGNSDPHQDPYEDGNLKTDAKMLPCSPNGIVIVNTSIARVRVKIKFRSLDFPFFSNHLVCLYH
jgi:hypothetical protein